MYKLIVENYRGEQLQLHPNKNYYVEIDGITGNKAAINTSVTGNGAGTMFNSSRTEERDIELTIYPLRDIEAARINIYRFFQSGKPVKLYYTNGTRAAWIEGYTEQAPQGSLFAEQEALEVNIKCPSPFWKSSATEIIDVSDIMPAFTFPFSIEYNDPIPFSTLVRAVEKTVYNKGDVESGVIIELEATGSVSNPKIYDAFGGSFGLKYALQAGDKVTINTYRGEKSVKLLRSGAEINLFPYVDDNPTWFSLDPGDNMFTFTASDTALLNVRYILYNLYEGV